MKTDTEEEEVVVVRITVIEGGCVQENVVNEEEQRGLEGNSQQNSNSSQPHGLHRKISSSSGKSNSS